MSVRVTDHALLKFIERAGGYDVERMRADLSASMARAAAAATSIDAREYVVRLDGLQYLVRFGVLVTVTPDAYPVRIAPRSAS